MNFIIVHGSWGNPNENWFPLLKSELERLDHKVFVPKFLTPIGQKLNVWLDVLKRESRNEVNLPKEMIELKDILDKIFFYQIAFIFSRYKNYLP